MQPWHCAQSSKGQIEQLRPRLSDDPKDFIHGHDLVSLLNYEQRRITGSNTVSMEATEAGLMCTLDTEQIATKPMFEKIRARVRL